jgi:hypothetical protein
MYRTLAKTIVLLVILLMPLEIVRAAATDVPSTSDRTVTLHAETESWTLGSFLFEKTEEETERSEEETDGMMRVILEDFSRIAVSLSFYHTPQVPFTALTFQYDARTPLHQLNCVFLI